MPFQTLKLLSISDFPVYTQRLLRLAWLDADNPPSRPAGKITPTFRYVLADDPSTTVVGLLVEYPPDGSTPPHRHGTASVIGYVIEGEIMSAMNEEEAKCYGKGGTWYEAPGCHHRISDNGSKTEKAVLHATFVIKTEILEKEGLDVLVQIDPEYLA